MNEDLEELLKFSNKRHVGLPAADTMLKAASTLMDRLKPGRVASYYYRGHRYDGHEFVRFHEGRLIFREIIVVEHVRDLRLFKLIDASEPPQAIPLNPAWRRVKASEIG